MKILVVDDEIDVQSLFLQKFRKELKENLVEFVFATSGEEALEFLSNKNQEVVLILSDINMPGMSGIELLGKIKTESNYAPKPVVMMVTAYGDVENYNLAMSFGADDFLTKPVDFSILKEKLKL